MMQQKAEILERMQKWNLVLEGDCGTKIHPFFTSTATVATRWKQSDDHGQR